VSKDIIITIHLERGVFTDRDLGRWLEALADKEHLNIVDWRVVDCDLEGRTHGNS
jgi:hypothetical protein